jgi:hypothetical protein
MVGGCENSKAFPLSPKEPGMLIFPRERDGAGAGRLKHQGA